MSLKKIVYVTSSLKVGGAETLLSSLVEHLHGEFDQHVIYFHDGPLRHTIEALGVRTYNILGLVSMYDPIFCIRLILLIHKLKPDAIHSLLWSANFLAIITARLLAIPIVSGIHTHKKNEGLIRGLLDYCILPQANTLIAVSPGIATSLQASNRHIASSRIKVITNGIHSQNFLGKALSTTMSRKLLGLSQQDFIIGSVGRLVKIKNYHVLLDALAPLMKDFITLKLILVGSGREYNALVAKAKHLTIEHQVIFIVDKQAAPYYHLFDIFVQPSASEGLSLALLEALTCNLPCIVTGIDYKHDVITHLYNGLVIQPNRIIELQKAILTLYKDSKLRTQIAFTGYKTVTNDYTIDNMVTQYKHIFKAL